MLKIIVIAICGFLVYWHFLSGRFVRLFRPYFGHANYQALRRSAHTQLAVGSGICVILLVGSAFPTTPSSPTEVAVLAGGFLLGHMCFLAG